MSQSQSHSSILRQKFPLITPSSNQEALCDIVNNHITILTAEKDRIVKLSQIIREDNENKDNGKVHQNKEKIVLNRNNNKSRTVLGTLCSTKNFYRTQRKMKTTQEQNEVSPYQPIFNFVRRDRKAKTIIINKNSKNLILLRRGVNLINAIKKEEKQTNDQAMKLCFELNSLKNMRYFSQDRFELKSTIEDKAMFKKMYYDDKKRKAYVGDLKAKEVLCQSQQISSINPLKIFNNRRMMAKKFGFGVISEDIAKIG